jgi:hypothetical protein
MNNVLQNIISLFSVVTISEGDITEDYSEVKIELSCDNGICPTEKQFEAALEILNGRDHLHLSILQDGEIVENYNSINDSSFTTFINSCRSCLNSNNFQISATIVKKPSEQTRSIYYPERFYHYLYTKSITHFIEIFWKMLNENDYIVFEVQDESFPQFATQTISFIPIRGQRQGSENRNINSLIKVKNLCHCPIIDIYQFVPEDFFPIVKNDTLLDEIFSRMSLLYSAFFLFDIFGIEDNILDYKLNGYKTISQKINYSYVDISSYETYFQIYGWVYDGGNIVDKIGLARNILSLNFNSGDLKIEGTTFEAIKSSYNIYQKENVKQYIEIRNRASDQLIELQNKADKIAENFVSDYKKSFLAAVSFFISVVVVKVVSKEDFVNGFTYGETILSLCFLCISLVVMFYARWEIKKQLDKYVEFYYNMKDRYNDLLDVSDIDRILNYDVDFYANKNFMEERRSKYTTLWVLSLGVLFVAVIVLFLIKNCN